MPPKQDPAGPRIRRHRTYPSGSITRHRQSMRGCAPLALRLKALGFSCRRPHLLHSHRTRLFASACAKFADLRAAVLAAGCVRGDWLTVASIDPGQGHRVGHWASLPRPGPNSARRAAKLPRLLPRPSFASTRIRLRSHRAGRVKAARRNVAASTGAAATSNPRPFSRSPGNILRKSAKATLASIVTIQTLTPPTRPKARDRQP